MFAKFAIAAATAALIALAAGSPANAQSMSVPPINMNKPAVAVPKPPVSTPLALLFIGGEARAFSPEGATAAITDFGGRMALRSASLASTPRFPTISPTTG